MSGAIYLIGDDSNLIRMNENAYDSEDVLQALLEEYPALLPGDQIDSLNPRKWLLITREMAVPDDELSNSRWSVDHLFLDQDGIPTLIEVKRSSDTRIRREVIGQLLEYAANAVIYWSHEKIRAIFEALCENKKEDPKNFLVTYFDEGIEYEEYWQKVKTNLQLGKIRLIFLADEIPFELKRVIEFLNEQMNPAEILGIEIKQYVSGINKALVPRIIGQSSKIQQKKSSAVNTTFQWDEASFMKELEKRAGVEEIELAKKILKWGKEKGLRIWWGKGKRYGSYFPMLDHKNELYWLFAVWTYSGIEIQFQWIKTKPLYEARSKRMKLLQNLNQIPGVNLPEKRIDKRPSISYSVLKDESSFKQFLKIWENYIDEIRSH